MYDDCAGKIGFVITVQCLKMCTFLRMHACVCNVIAIKALHGKNINQIASLELSLFRVGVSFWSSLRTRVRTSAPTSCFLSYIFIDEKGTFFSNKEKLLLMNASDPPLAEWLNSYI